MSVHLEGRMSVQAAIDAGRRSFESILVRDDADERLNEVLAAARKKKIPVRRVSESELDEVAHGKTHGGLIALCSERTPDPEPALDAILDREKAPFLLLIEGVEDPRNFGFTLRTAEALGIHAVILKKHAWDFDETALCRASSGAFERMCVVRTGREDGLLERLKKRGLAVWACVPNVMGTPYDADLRGPLVLAVGGEKRGLSGAVRSQCTGFMRIPMKAGATSLSMDHAAAIVMAEAARQRRSESVGE